MEQSLFIIANIALIAVATLLFTVTVKFVNNRFLKKQVNDLKKDVIRLKDSNKVYSERCRKLEKENDRYKQLKSIVWSSRYLEENYESIIGNRIKSSVEDTFKENFKDFVIRPKPRTRKKS